MTQLEYMFILSYDKVFTIWEPHLKYVMLNFYNEIGFRNIIQSLMSMHLTIIYSPKPLKRRNHKSKRIVK